MTIKINASTPYEVVIEKGALCRIKDLLKDGQRVLVVSDSNVMPIYGNRFVGAEKLTLKAGEKHKNLKTIQLILKTLQRLGFTRSDTVVGLGGGVVGDMAAFASSIYMRGIRYVACPTSLLAMIDSSVGGKTGVDFLGSKNMVGSFYQPSLVICDTDCLKTLPEREIKNGMGEAVKYAVLTGDEEMLDDCLSENKAEKFIAKCVTAKKEIVEADEKDKGVRALLNLGHTFGHAIEKLSRFKIAHGVAVAMGIRVATKVAVGAKVTTLDNAEKIEALLDRYNMPKAVEYNKKDFIDAVWLDKKRTTDGINLVLPEKTGVCKTVYMTKQEVLKLI